MTAQEMRQWAARTDTSVVDLRRVLAEAADRVEATECGRFEIAVLEPSLLESKNKEFGSMMRFTLGTLYEESPEVKLGMATRGCLAVRGHGGNIFASPPSTRTRFNAKYCPYVWTQALHDMLVKRIEASPWADMIGGDAGRRDKFKDFAVKGAEGMGLPEEI